MATRPLVQLQTGLQPFSAFYLCTRTWACKVQRRKRSIGEGKSWWDLER